MRVRASQGIPSTWTCKPGNDGRKKSKSALGENPTKRDPDPGPSVQDPSKMDFALGPELDSVGPWIAGFLDDPVSDELTEECEFLLVVGEGLFGTEPVDRPRPFGLAQPGLLLGHGIRGAREAP